MPKGRADGVSIRVSPFLRTKATVFLLSLFCAIHKCGRSLYVRIFYFSKAGKYGTASFHRAFARFHKGDTRRQLNSHIGKEYRVRGNARGNERVKARKTRSTSRRAGAVCNLQTGAFCILSKNFFKKFLKPTSILKCVGLRVYERGHFKLHRFRGSERR